MADLKIRVFEGDQSQLCKTITIPNDILKIASKIIPKQAMTHLENEGIDLNELIKLSSNPEVSGTLIEIEDHKKNRNIVISLE